LQPPLEPAADLSHAVPATDVGRMPSTADQYRALETAIGKQRPSVEKARADSAALRSAADALRRKLVDSASRVQALEKEQESLGSEIASLSAEDARLSAAFARDRVSVARLVALIERLESDTPPAMVLRPEDALGAARASMVVGASLPEIYAAAASLAGQIRALKATRASLLAKRTAEIALARKLSQARSELDQLLAIREAQSSKAGFSYSVAKAQLDEALARAGDLKTLLERVSALRMTPSQGNAVVVVTADAHPVRGREWLVTPVIGKTQATGPEDSLGPGLTFITQAGAEVVAPADARVLFSGPYHKYGHVLILQTARGYDAVLAGLGRVDVRPEDQVLAGEPVGTMPDAGPQTRLYFELRENGRGMDPTPFLSLALRKAKKT